MKKVILIFLLFSSINLFAKEYLPIWVRTSAPDYNKMMIVDTSVSTATILKTKKVNGKSEYVTFTEAFSEFHKRTLSTVQTFIKKNKYDGVCNFKINFNITKEGYYFLVSYDAYVNK